ncbi:HD-GYP domain-containing protein [Spirochaetia bacterium 38H-sp]|uniref:HD-GYP domain-containing protein n=1 Tax=Rarispira pelagica TaxID=3141764 RepID=A0ABU9UDX1_9SPIR
MKEISISELKPGTYSTEDVYLDQEYILLNTDLPIKQELIHRLIQWNFTSVFTTGEFIENSIGTTPKEKDFTEENKQKASLSTEISEQNEIKEVREYFTELVNKCENIFSSFLNNQKIGPNTTTEIAKNIINAVKTKQPFIFRLQELEDNTRNYLVIHSAKTAILAAGLGLRLQMPQHKLVDLVTAALLHEIGMIRLPSKLYLAKRRLSPEEKKAITAHPVIGYKLLKQFGFPLQVCLAVLEHHEHLDGTGYPRALKDVQISKEARIIGICTSYAAFTSERPYRPAVTGHNSLLDMLKLSGKWYDETLLRSLIFMISLFPIGTYVMLQSGAKGIVMESNPENPRCPIVKLLYNENGARLKDPLIIRTDDGANTIRRALAPKEIEALK